MEELNKLTNNQLIAKLIEAGVAESEVKNLKKAELIEKLVSLELGDEFERFSKEELIEQMRAANEVVKDLKGQLKEKSTVKAPASVTVNGKVFHFKREKFTVPNVNGGRGGQEYEAAKLAAAYKENEPQAILVVNHLINKKSGVIAEV